MLHTTRRYANNKSMSASASAKNKKKKNTISAPALKKIFELMGKASESDDKTNRKATYSRTRPAAKLVCKPVTNPNNVEEIYTVLVTRKRTHAEYSDDYPGGGSAWCGACASTNTKVVGFHSQSGRGFHIRAHELQCGDCSLFTSYKYQNLCHFLC